jgi:uncharacterized membrane protein YfhO
VIYSFFKDYEYIKYAHAFTEKELSSPTTIKYFTKEHLPIGVGIDNIQCKDLKEAVSVDSSNFEITKWESAERIITVDAREPLAAGVRTFYFPGWKAYLDSAEITIKTDTKSGGIVIDIPKGKHTLEIKFIDTPIRNYAKLISLISLSVTGLLLFIYRH